MCAERENCTVQTPEPSHHIQSNLLRLRSLHDHTPPQQNFTSRTRKEKFFIHHSKSKATTRIKKTNQNISLDFKVACKPELFSNHAPFLFFRSLRLLSFYRAFFCRSLLAFAFSNPKYSLFKTIAIISIHYLFLLSPTTALFCLCLFNTFSQSHSIHSSMRARGKACFPIEVCCVPFQWLDCILEETDVFLPLLRDLRRSSSPAHIFQP